MNADDQETVRARPIDMEHELIKLGRRLLAVSHGMLSGPAGDPSEAEIKAMTAAIRSERPFSQRRQTKTTALPSERAIKVGS